MAGLIRLNNLQVRNLLLNNSYKAVRLISTSQKRKDTATVAESCTQSETKTDVKKNWMSYGFDFKDEKADRSAMNSSFFFSVTLCLVVGGFIWAYLPDPMLRDWAQREAYLVLRHRESSGKEPIDKNYINPEKIVLPSESELGDTEIII